MTTSTQQGPGAGAAPVPVFFLSDSTGISAAAVTDDQLNPASVTPSVFNPDVHSAVATAVRRAAGGPAELPGDVDDEQA